MTTFREEIALAATPTVLRLTQQCVQPLSMAAVWAVDYADKLIEELAKSAPKPAAAAPRNTCTDAERELIEADLAYMKDLRTLAWNRISRARLAVLAERAKEASK